MAEHGITGELADEIYARIQAFANFGFAESHAISFALLVYASSWLKLHYPGAFLAGLLRAQPMGFYSPQSLVADARRHGVTVLRPDIAASAADAGLEPVGTGSTAAADRKAGVPGPRPAAGTGASMRQRRTGRRSTAATVSAPFGWASPRCRGSVGSWPSGSSPSATGIRSPT